MSRMASAFTPIAGLCVQESASFTSSYPRLWIPNADGSQQMLLQPRARYPRFRHVHFQRDEVSDPGGTTAPRMTVPHMLPSALMIASASAILWISWLNTHPTGSLCTLHGQRHRCPPGRPLRRYPVRIFTGLNAPALPGAPKAHYVKSLAISCGNRWQPIHRASPRFRSRNARLFQDQPAIA
jgi:hypothetical protein